MADQTFSGQIIIDFAGEMERFGKDKVLHYLANVSLSQISGGEDEDILAQLFQGFCESLRVSIRKEVQDRGISQNDAEVQAIIVAIDDIENSFISMLKVSMSIELDRGDIYADLVGAFLGASLLAIKNMDFEFGAE